MSSTMTPREIVHELDRHIVGQDAAKRAVALPCVVAGDVCSCLIHNASKSLQKIF